MSNALAAQSEPKCCLDRIELRAPDADPEARA
jgi:hypothetical protein